MSRKGNVIRGIIILLIVLLIGYGGFKGFMAIELAGVPSTDIWMEDDAYHPDTVPRLAMTPGEDYRILVLADIQLESHPIKDRNALKAVRKMVEKTQPDFIMTAGDNTSWVFADIKTKQLIKVMESFGIPWGVTLGNHDAEGRADRIWHGNRYEDAEYSLFRSGPSNIHGVGNYGINLTNGNGEIVYSLIMMDSNVLRQYEEGEDYDFIYYDQIKWYEWMVRGVSEAEGRPVPSLAFFHIPLPEFNDAVEAWNSGKIDPADGFGETREGVFCPPFNTGLFSVMKDLGSTTHIFNGHDHVNNLSVDWEGIRMTYVQKTGRASYSDRDMLGGTLVTIADGTYDVKVEHIDLNR